jgi:GT2 family glycosyltransferase
VIGDGEVRADEYEAHDKSPHVPRRSHKASCAAVIVHYQTPAQLSSCVSALREQTYGAMQIVVVDNSPHPVGLSGRPPTNDEWAWIPTKRNVGFGAACNLGADATDSDFVLFINADVILEPDACERLCKVAEHDERIAVVGPRIRAEDGTIELSAREFPTTRTAVFGRSSLLTQWLMNVKHIPRGVSAALGPSGAVDWVSGACMLIRRGAFDEIGGFDEGYWMYWEDADICRRLRGSGWHVALCTEAVVHHRAGSSGISERTVRAFHASAGRYFERHVARTSLSANLAKLLLTVRMRLALGRRPRSQ